IFDLVGGLVKAIEEDNVLGSGAIVPEMVEDVDKTTIALPKNPVQFQINHPRLFERMGFKKVHALIELPQHLPFMVFDDGRQLNPSPDHQHLHARERFIKVSLYTS